MMQWLLNKIVATKVWEWFATHVLSPATLRVFGYPTFPMERFFDIIDACVEWQRSNSGIFVFLSRDRMALTTSLLKSVGHSEWPHIGVLVVDNFRNARVIHMQSPGLMDWHLLQLLREIDDFCVVAIRLSKQDTATAYQRLAKAKQRAIPYDFQFSLGDGRLYCSEFVFNVVLSKLTSVTPLDIDGRKAYLPAQALEVGEVIFRRVGNA